MHISRVIGGWISLIVLSAMPVVGQVQITEFMASNTKGLRDDFGQYEDWIEISNSSSGTVNLLDWALTDNLNGLSKWRFPSTNLPPKGFLVVFASNRDRRIPGMRLHTNFKLEADGENLALVRPDGTIASQYAPYPPQQPDVSFGSSVQSTGTLLIKTNSVGRYFVPQNGNLEHQWIDPRFNDTAWAEAIGGIGYETGQNDDPDTIEGQILADKPSGFWSFSEKGGNTTSNSGTAGSMANGQILSGITSGVPGPRPPSFPGFDANNTAMRFNGTGGKIEVPYSPELNPKDSFTVEIWAKPARTGGSAAWPISSLNLSGGRSGYALAQDYAARNTWEFRMGDNSGYITTSVYGGKVDTNNWQHLVGVFDGTTAKLYVNGVLAASSTLSRPFVPNTAQKLVIGGRIDTANPYYYAGDLDAPAVYSRAFSAAEISARYQMAIKGLPARDRYSYTGLFQTDLTSSMYGINSSVYLRIPFYVTNVMNIDRLVLRLRYEDGFFAFINGMAAASANTLIGPNWNSTAAIRHPASDAIQFQEFDLSSHISSLNNDTNILAIQGCNLSATNTDFLLQAELEVSDASADYSRYRYFTQATPGSINGVGSRDLGPIIMQAGHSPLIPNAIDSITVTCRVSQAFAPVSSVTLFWQIMFNATNQLPMYDDGMHGDGTAGDGVYGAVIPCYTEGVLNYSTGQMVRWRMVASDTMSRTSHWPLFESKADSAEFLGTVIEPGSVSSKIPVFHLFAPPTVLQPGPQTQRIGADSENGGRVAMYYDGEFYDNIYMELRGNTSAGLPKKAHRLEFNREHPFRHPGPGGRVRKSSLLSEMLDPAYIRQHLCFWLLDLMGVPSPFNYPVRVQLNGEFYQLAFHSDVLGEEQLERLGYDPDGVLYKCVGQVNPQFSSTGGFQKLLPKTNLTDRADYLILANGINESQSLQNRRIKVFDLMDVAEVVNYLAGARFCAENDDVWANMCMYRDSQGDGLWRIISFDMNASWGQLYGGSSPLQATNDRGKSHPFYGGSQVQENGNSAWNRVYDVIIALPETREMLKRRQRTLLDQWVLPPNTPQENLFLENHIKYMTNLITVEANLDRAKWGYSPWASGKRFSDGINDLLNQFVKLRRTHWYVTHSITNTAKPLGLTYNNNAGIPLSQPTNAIISIFAWDSNPASGNQDEEYLCLTNSNDYAVDVSGWKLDGDIDHKLQPGTVIPPGSVMYLSPSVAVFRNRAMAPRGGMGLFVQGNYKGHLSAWGGTLNLSDPTGRLVTSTNIPGDPTLAQKYLRITEIMYNPESRAGDTNESQSYEFVELKNLSTNMVLDLKGIRFTNGIYFTFISGSQLQPGQTVLLARDTNAFLARYGAELNVAGQFTGALDSAGERIRLEDASGEIILDFSFNNSWHPTTDGQGYSLVVINDLVQWKEWDKKDQWRPSTNKGGSPGTSDPAPLGIEPFEVYFVLKGSNLSISLVSKVGFFYVLEFADNLNDVAWAPLTQPVSGSGSVLEFNDVIQSKTVRFYRIRAAKEQ